MKPVVRCLGLVVCVMLITGSVFAGEPGGGNETQGEYEMSRGMMPPRHDMMPMMTHKSMVATSDGGVIVMAGNKLQKYDKDLNLKKEVELPKNAPEISGMIGGMKKQCPLMNAYGSAEKNETSN